eukprot:CAMPEP_0181474322 /NCGR_PEP_ID=MMETSP1110-20121109/40590_1 /TAXON_ID=174948 /ORGANISM="Symbiodinium sp., Strain CCMP421" /LENGTH=257 /DNA_ID=CAMNT_0023599487 /DNA_START=34 /DNA_END=807 /DNA_ORIENTATION=+
MPSFQFEVEYSKSGRAACKQCKEKIDKDAVRIGVKMAVDMEGAAGADAAERQKGHAAEATKWHHAGCFPKIKKPAWFRQHLPENDEDITGFDSLRQEDQDRVKEVLKTCRGEDVQDGKRKPDASDRPSKKAKVAEEGKAREDAEASALSAQQREAIDTLKAELSKKSVAALGCMLHKNGLPKSGRKEELLERVAEAKALGVPPVCPTCDKAKLRFSRVSGDFSCPGFFDDEAKRHKRCKGPSAEAMLVRTCWQEMGA